MNNALLHQGGVCTRNSFSLDLGVLLLTLLRTIWLHTGVELLLLLLLRKVKLLLLEHMLDVEGGAHKVRGNHVRRRERLLEKHWTSRLLVKYRARRLLWKVHCTQSESNFRVKKKRRTQGRVMRR